MAESHLNPSRSSLTKQEQEDLNKRLYEAAEAGRTEDVVQLIKSGADVNYEFFLTVLGIASLKCHTETVMTLLQLGADLEKRDGSKRTAIHHGCMSGSIDVVQFVLNQGGFSLQDTDEYGMTGLHYACRGGHLELIKWLIDQGMSLDTPSKDGMTGLHFACWGGHLELIKWLIDQGLSLDTPNKLERTGLHYACQEGHLELIKWLIDQGLSMDTPDMRGTTPLDMLKNTKYGDDACKERKKKCLDYLKGRTEGSTSTDSPNTDSKGDIESEDSPSADSKGDIESEAPSNGEGRASNTKDDEKMTQLVQTQIKKKGRMKLRNVKGILIGSPGVGKTVTINRLTGKMRNISLDGGVKSTGLDKPLLFHLYHDTEKKSIMIGKFWSPQTLDEQLGTLFHCMSQSTPGRKEEEYESSLELPLVMPKKDFLPSKQGVPQQSASTHSQSMSIPMDAYIILLQEFIRQSKWDTVQCLLEGVSNTTLFHVIDTGGQPEFFEILPLLLRGPCFSLIFLNLAHPLKEPFQVTYRDTPTSHSLVEYHSTYTQLEMVHMLLASIHSLNSGKEFSQKSSAFLIATHLDEAKSVDIQQIAKEIEDSLKGKSFYHEDVLAKYFCHERKVQTFLYALDNLNGGEKEVSLLREILTYLIKNIFPPESLPTSWGVFHLMLRHKYEEKGLCKVQQSDILGKACGLIENDEVKMALKFFHNRFGTILYYPEVESLQSIVICDPNLLFRPITRLVGESFGANSINPETAEQIRRTGEISYNFFEKVCVQNDPLQRIPTKAIIDLLKYHNIVTEVVNGDKRLFMSCLLKPSPTEEAVDMASMEVAPLLFTFYPQGYQPICLFHVLASRLLQSKEFQLDKTRYRNMITFRSGKAKVEIRSTTTHLKVQVKKCSPKRCIYLRSLLQEKLNSIVADVPHMMKTQVDISFFCPKCCKHIANLREFDALEDEECSRALFCPKCNDSLDLQACHEIWFNDHGDANSGEVVQKGKGKEEKEKQTDTCTSSSTLKRNDSNSILMKIPEVNDVYRCLKPKACDWSKIAREFAVDFSFRKELEKSNALDADDKLEHVIWKWNESESSDLTWETVITAMEELQYLDVVRNVYEFLAKPNVIKKYHGKKFYSRQYTCL